MIRSTMLLAVGWFKNFKHVFTHVNIWVHINQNEEHDLLNALHSKEAGRLDILRLTLPVLLGQYKQQSCGQVLGEYLRPTLSLGSLP